MLIISRRPGEELYIGEDITVRILKIDGHKVQIAIDAPPDVKIRRDNCKKDEHGERI
jgi:carbon storage regulator